MKRTFVLSFFVMAYIFYGFIVANFNLEVLSQEIKKEQPAGYFDYRGVINVHSHLSTGSGTPQSIVSEAKVAGLDYLILTDVNPFERPEGFEGYHENLLALFGGEYSYVDSRLLYLGDKGISVGRDLGDSQIHFADRLSQEWGTVKDELIIMAHPLREGFGWSGDYPAGLHGIEVVNLKSVLAASWKKSKLSFLWSLVILPFNTRMAFMRLYTEPNEELVLWDKLSERHPTIGVLGNDSTAKAIPFSDTWVRFPSHERAFSIGSNHLLLKSELTGHFQSDRSKIFAALRNGNFYFSIDIVADPKGFNAILEDRDKKYLMGSEVKFNHNQSVSVHLPSKPNYDFEIVLFRNGERIDQASEVDAKFKIREAGVYRVTVRVIPTYPPPDGKRWITWIYGNPFFIRE